MKQEREMNCQTLKCWAGEPTHLNLYFLYAIIVQVLNQSSEYIHTYNIIYSRVEVYSFLFRLHTSTH